MTVGELRMTLLTYPDTHIIVGQCLTPEGTWLTLPIDIGKAIGDNTMVIIQMKSMQEVDNGER